MVTFLDTAFNLTCELLVQLDLLTLRKDENKSYMKRRILYHGIA
jgi:hypothetical protein